MGKGTQVGSLLLPCPAALLLVVACMWRARLHPKVTGAFDWTRAAACFLEARIPASDLCFLS